MLFLIGFNHFSLTHNNCSNWQGIINSVLKTSKPSRRSWSIASHGRSSFCVNCGIRLTLLGPLWFAEQQRRFVIFFFVQFYNHHPNSQKESLQSHPHFPMKLNHFLFKTLSYRQYLVLACHWTLTQKWHPHLALEIKGQSQARKTHFLT